jgi:hypothetical protein
MSEINGHYVDDYQPIHAWFSLSYANYFVMARSVLQAMPAEWQKKFVVLINELHDTLEYDDEDIREYQVTARQRGTGHYIKDKLANYKYPVAGAIHVRS